MDRFFDANNPLMRFLARLVDLVILNVLTVVFALPLITAGASFTAMNYVILHYVREDETYTFRMFWKSFRENLKPGIAVGLIYMGAAAVTALDLWILRGLGSRTATALMIIITVAACLILVTAVYSFALLSRYENTVAGTLANAVRLTLGNLPRSLVMLLIWAGWLALLYLTRRGPVLAVTFGLSLPGFLCGFAYDKIFRRLEEKSSD